MPTILKRVNKRINISRNKMDIFLFFTSETTLTNISERELTIIPFFTLSDEFMYIDC